MGVVRQLIIGRDGRCRAATVQVKSSLLMRPVRKLYKLELCAESVNLPPITSPPENTDKDDVILDSEDEVTDGGEDEVECEVSLPQKTRRGRVIVRPSRNMLPQVARWRMTKAEPEVTFTFKLLYPPLRTRKKHVVEKQCSSCWDR